MFKFETLNVWHKSVEFADIMISIAEVLPQKYQYSFGNQMRRAGLSVPNKYRRSKRKEVGERV